MKKFGWILGLVTIFYAHCIFATTLHKLKFDNLIVFGDSLSDVGNEPHAPITTPGGSTWVYYLGQNLGLKVTPSTKGGNDYAYAGALSGPLPYTVTNKPPSLIEQVHQYLAKVQHHADPNTLYTLQAGANDFSNASAFFMIGYLQYHRKFNDLVQQIALQSATNVSEAIKMLQQAGAQHILVGSLPNLNQTPAGHAYIIKLITKLNQFQSVIVDHDQQKLMHYAKNANQFLAQKINDRSSGILLLNNYKLLNLLQTDYQAFGFVSPFAMYGDGKFTNPDQYIFASDGYHPSAKTNLLAAQYAMGLLQGPPYAPSLITLYN